MPARNEQKITTFVTLVTNESEVPLRETELPFVCQIDIINYACKIMT